MRPRAWAAGGRGSGCPVLCIGGWAGLGPCVCPLGAVRLCVCLWWEGKEEGRSREAGS